MSTGWQREGDRGVSGDRDTGATEWHPDSLYDPAGGVGSVRFCSQRASEFKGREQWTPPLAGGAATSGKNTWLEEPPCLALGNTHLPCRRDAVFVLE